MDERRAAHELLTSACAGRSLARWEHWICSYESEVVD